MANNDNQAEPGGHVLDFLGLAYGLGAFVMAFGIWSYFALFLGNFPPRSTPWIEPTVSVGPSLGTLPAFLVDVGLILLFGLQHSLMARPHFKAWLTRFVAPNLERSTYVFAANIAFVLLLVFWQPIPMVLWDLGDGVWEDLVWYVFGFGWIILLLGIVSIDPYELLGLRQAWAWFQIRPYEARPLKTHWLYRYIRHPLYLGVLVMVWAAPYMTLGHLLLAVGFTLYIVIGMRLEERDLVHTRGESYRTYQQTVPALLPRFWASSSRSNTSRNV